MIIAGLQKLTLLDYPGKMAATLFTHGCNFRCPFCHNAPLVTDKLSGQISEEEFFSFLSSRRGILDAVCITGGEPTLQKDLPEFIGKIKAMGFLVKLDTNGTNPDLLATLIEEGLIDYVAMDIKNAPDKYDLTCGCDVDMDKVLTSVDILKMSGIDHEFRTTVVRELHTAEDLEAIARGIIGDSKYFLQQFIDGENVIAGGLHPYTDGEMKEIAEHLKGISGKISLRGV